VEEVRTQQQPQLAGVEPQLIARISTAFQFVKQCNDHMGLRGFPDAYGVEIKELDLHPAQEAAMRRACALLGQFFDGKDLSAGEESHGSQSLLHEVGA
jgi:hypothetical protein